VPAVLLLLLACPSKDRDGWDWRAHVRRTDGTEFVLPPTDRGPVLLVFSSIWATPCAPLLSELEGLSDRAQVLVVKADPEAPAMAGDSFGYEVLVPTGYELVERMVIQVLPTAVLFDRSGRQVERYEGYSTSLVARIEAALDEDIKADDR
jgi:thiol-disulfide isomerase/thioredoxin